MTSQKQVAANRRNAAKCTGPKTAEGKATSRLNAFRHGLRARTLIPPGDDQSELDQLTADIRTACDPQSPHEHLLLDKMVAAEWQLARLQRSESNVLIEQQGAMDAAHVPLFDRFSQRRAAIERTSIRAYKEFLQLVKTRPQRQDL